MKIFSLLFLAAAACLSVHAQPDSLRPVRLVIGVSAPELLHAGIHVDLTKSNQIGASAGIGPTWGGVWPTLSAEHRLYFGKVFAKTQRRHWFFRQSFTYFPADKDKAISLTIGGDLRSKKGHRGWTIDAGAFMLWQEDDYDRENIIGPALRFQYYFYFKDRK